MAAITTALDDFEEKSLCKRAGIELKIFCLAVAVVENIGLAHLCDRLRRKPEACA